MKAWMIVGTVMLAGCDALLDVDECKFDRCGGDPVGRWVIDDEPLCIGDGDWRPMDGECEGITQDVSKRAVGSMAINADGTIVCDTGLALQYRARVPKDCVPAVHVSGCGVLEPMLSAAFADAAFVCDGGALDGACTCEAERFVPSDEKCASTWRVVDDTLVIGDEAVGRPFCIEDDQPNQMKLMCPGTEPGEQLPFIYSRVN